jgi:hypothetical protein
MWSISPSHEGHENLCFPKELLSLYRSWDSWSSLPVFFGTQDAQRYFCSSTLVVKETFLGSLVLVSKSFSWFSSALKMHRWPP